MSVLPDARFVGPRFSGVFIPENPLSGNGRWAHLDSLLTTVQVDLLSGVNVAHSSQTGSGPNAPYDDSTAYLPGFGPNHHIRCIVWRDPTIASTPNMEVELLLRWSDDNPVRSTPYGDTHSDGYEININQNGEYLQLGRFKGALLASAGSPPVPATFDVFEARIQQVTSTSVWVRVWWNGVLKIDYIDSASPPAAGFPGIGFFMSNAGGGFNNKLGFIAADAWSV